MQALTTRDLSVVAGEPRVHDLTLGQSLGFGRPRRVREIIERHRGELQRYGTIAPHIAAQFEVSPRSGAEFRDTASRKSGVLHQTDAKRRRGAPTKGFYLNEGQALLVCMFSETDKAADVREQLIRVFMAYRAGELQKAPQPARAKRLVPDIPVTDPRHPKFKDPMLPVAKRREMVSRVRTLEDERADAQMIASLPHLLAPAGRAGRVTFPRFYRDKEVLSAVLKTHRSAPLDEVAELLRYNFGYRAPSRSALGRFWVRLDGLFGTGRRLH